MEFLLIPLMLIDLVMRVNTLVMQAQQNQVRGSISRLRSRAFSSHSGAPPLRVFRQDLLANLLSARAELPAQLYGDFLAWVQEVVPRVVPEFTGQPIQFDYLAGFSHRARPVSLAKEIQWIVRRAALASVQLSAFRRQAKAVEQRVFEGDWDAVLRMLESVAAEFGESYWGIQLRMAVEQARHGLEAQKQYTKVLRRVYGGGALSFIAYYTSVRNEERSSWRRFVETVEGRLADRAIDSTHVNYLRYRLILTWPTTEPGIADVLRLEQGHNILDVYETLVALLQHICVSPQWDYLRSVATDGLKCLSGIEDFRLDKLALILAPGLRPTRLPDRPSLVSDQLLADGPRAALLAVQRIRKSADVDPWHIIYHGTALAHGRGQSRRGQRPSKELPSLLASALRRDAASVNSIGQLEKVASNLAGVPFAAAMRGFCGAIRDNDPAQLLSTTRVNLNCAFCGFEDIDSVGVSAKATLLEARSKQPASPTALAWRSVALGETAAYPSSLEIFGSALHKLRAGRPAEAKSALSPLLHADGPLQLFTAKLRLAAEIAMSDRGSIIETIASETANNEVSPSFLPVADALASFQWSDYQKHAKDLSAAIALEALQRVTEKDSVSTMLRFAFSYHLKQSGYERPSSFVDHVDAFDRKKLIYYLRKICVASIMDMSAAFKTSREVIEERRSICAALKTLDPPNSSEYDAEIFEITNQIVIADGLQFVDSSRIHVDTDSISRWARKHLAEDYARCADLIRAGIGTGTDLDKVLRDVLGKLGGRQVLFTPGDQADDLLADMLARLREQFLSNPAYGLDYYLSKRVRHQSFVGLVRGPLEFQNLITTRESEFGPYRRNDSLLNGLAPLSDDQRERLSQKLAEFAERFDSLLTQAKNEKFQIRSEQLARGIFDITLTSQMMIVTRNLIAQSLGFDDFLRMAYRFFWAALDPSLAEAHRAIAEDLKSEITRMFDGLRADLREIAGSAVGFLELSTTIGDVSVEVQRSLDAAARWFVRFEGVNVVENRTLKQCLDIAVESALKSHRGFEPTLNVLIKGDANLNGPDLLLLVDTVSIALDNVRRHSGLGKDAVVHVTCDVTSEVGTIWLSVRNTVAPGVRSEDVETRLARIKAQIADGNVGRGTRTEGGSGFLKLAATLQESSERPIEFGFTESGDFRLDVFLRPYQFSYALVRP